MDDAAFTRMLARNRFLESELERVDTERARLLEQISGAGITPDSGPSKNLLTQTTGTPPMICVAEIHAVLRPGTTVVRPVHNRTSGVARLTLTDIGDGRVSFFGSFGHAGDSWNLSGLSESDLDELSVAIDSQRARGVGNKP